MGRFDRLLRPRSILVVGGGTWGVEVLRQCQKIGFQGDLWILHPTKDEIAGLTPYRTLADLPGAPDAVYIGVNRHATIEIVRELHVMGAGGAICFASGFQEAVHEDAAAADLQTALLEAAGEMPIIGPNCYGFLNYLDDVAMWPDQHGGVMVESGVALITQSSNIAINLTMQQRALPVAYAITCGNMAQTDQAQIAMALLDDPRVTAIGLHVEGFGNIRAWEEMAQKAWGRGVPLVALKVGASDQARQATVSHTASLAGSDAGAQALLDRLGIPRLHSLPDLLETLKLLHVHGHLSGTRIASISCSGGEASLMADMAQGTGLTFPALTSAQSAQLRGALGPMVALANPLDYHTYIWRDADAMARAWGAMTGDGIDMTLSIVDYPRTDPTDWACATEAALAARKDTGRPFGMVATLPELMPFETAHDLAAGGVVPFMGLGEALAAVQAAALRQAPHTLPVTLGPGCDGATVLTEDTAKDALAEHGLIVPVRQALRAGETADAFSEPVAVKGLGLAHKTEAGAVHLNVEPADIARVGATIGTERVLVEEMVGNAVAELLIGVTHDPAHGFVLTIGAGGVLTELMQDTVSLLLPVTADDVTSAMERLKSAPLLRGYRGAPAANTEAVMQAVLAIQSYVLAHLDTVSEVEVNPLICTPDRAVAVDALIRKA